MIITDAAHTQDSGFPPNLSETDFDNTILKLQQTANNCKHPGAKQPDRDVRIQVVSGPEVLPSSVVTSNPQKSTSSQGSMLSMPSMEPGAPQDDKVLQEVTQYCPISGCNFRTYETFDPNLLDACIKQLSLHMKVSHDMGSTDQWGDSSNNSPSTVPDKSQREYKEATRQRHVKKTVDDANLNLSEARFFAVPLDNKVVAQNMPIVNTPINSVVTFSHLGVDVATKDLIRKLHNRAETGLRLKNFSETNLKNFHAAGDEMVAVKYEKDQLQLGKKQKALEDPKECVKAFFNYAAMHGQIHPLDWSPKALLKVVLDKASVGSPRVSEYEHLFERFINENAGRAQKSGVPMTYAEIVSLWTTFISPNPVAINKTYVDKMVHDSIMQQVKGNKPLARRQGGGSSLSPIKKPRLEFCTDWNANKAFPLCTNTQVQGGCKTDDDKFLKHSCSKKVDSFGRRCGSENHGFYKH